MALGLVYKVGVLVTAVPASVAVEAINVRLRKRMVGQVRLHRDLPWRRCDNGRGERHRAATHSCPIDSISGSPDLRRNSRRSIA